MGLLILALGFAPGIFWLWYLYNRYKLDSEISPLVLRTFIWGVLIAIPAALAELLFFWTGYFLSAVIIGPIIEEFSKYWVVRQTVYHRVELSDPRDGIVYAAAAALGFASIENVVYLFGVMPQWGWQGVGFILVARALLSVPVHVLVSSFWGAALGRAKSLGRLPEAERLVHLGLVSAMALHGLFNLLLLSVAELGEWAALILLVLLFIAWALIRRHRRKNWVRLP